MKKFVLSFAVAALLFGCTADQEEITENSEITEISESPELESKAAIQNRNRPFERIRRRNYHMMKNIWNFDKGGADRNQRVWIEGINRWGAVASHRKGPKINGEYHPIKAYPALLIGDHWGDSTNNDPFPRKIADMGRLNTNWTQNARGNNYNAAYDIWFDDNRFPGKRSANYELMIWLDWKGMEPIARRYNANGAVPYARDVRIGSRTYDVFYRTHNYRPYRVMTFRVKPGNKFNGRNFNANIKDFTDYCVRQGWLNRQNHFITSVQAGWEIIEGGSYATSRFSLQ